MHTVTQLLISGLLAGGIYALMAVGLTLTFGVLKIANFSHGEFVMVGMYMTYFLYQSLGLSPYVSTIIVAVLMFAIGLLLEKSILRRTIGEGDMIQVFLTVGLSFFLMNLALVLFHGDYLRVPIPFAASSFEVGQFYFAKPQLYTFISAGIVISILFWALKYTYMGKTIRAVTEDRDTARLMGINVNLVYSISFGLGLAVTGISAALLTTLFPVFPTVGSYFVLIAFVVVVLGGVGSVMGALVGGLLIGCVESLAGYYIGSGWKEAVYFVIFILVLISRPQGIFGKRAIV
jgi:branched-chain amino acid transport system permease protein